MRSRRIPGFAVPVLAVVLALSLAGATATVVERRGRRSYCTSATVQYEYTAGGLLTLNSYADVNQRVCLTPPGASPQFVDLLVRVTVQIEVGRDVPIFEPESTWADLEISVDGRPMPRRCEFPELSRLTPYALWTGRIGHDRALTKHCRFDLPPADWVTVRLTFHGVEWRGPHSPVSGPISVDRKGGNARCTRGARPVSCDRVDL